MKIKLIATLIAAVMFTSCSQYAFKDLGDGRGTRGLMGAPIGEVYTSILANQAAQANLRAAQTPQRVDVHVDSYPPMYPQTVRVIRDY
jgi:hypothetical protein